MFSKVGKGPARQVGVGLSTPPFLGQTANLYLLFSDVILHLNVPSSPQVETAFDLNFVCTAPA
jgi:hypothetical protein